MSARACIGLQHCQKGQSESWSTSHEVYNHSRSTLEGSSIWMRICHVFLNTFQPSQCRIHKVSRGAWEPDLQTSSECIYESCLARCWHREEQNVILHAQLMPQSTHTFKSSLFGAWTTSCRRDLEACLVYAQKKEEMISPIGSIYTQMRMSQQLLHCDGQPFSFWMRLRLIPNQEICGTQLVQHYTSKDYSGWHPSQVMAFDLVIITPLKLWSYHCPIYNLGVQKINQEHMVFLRPLS